MHACLVVRVSHAVAIHHVEHDIGERVGDIFTLGVRAAYDSGLHDEETPVVFRHRTGDEHDVLNRLRAEEKHQLERLLAGEAAPVDVLLVIGVEVLVYTPERYRGVDALEHHREVGEPQRLERFPEGLGGLARHFPADARYLLEFTFALLGLLDPGHPLGLFGEPLRPSLEGLARDAGGRGQVGVHALHGLDVTVGAEPDDLLVVGEEMAYASRLVDDVVSRTQLVPHVASHPQEAGKHPGGYALPKPVRHDPGHKPQAVFPGDLERVGLPAV